MFEETLAYYPGTLLSQRFSELLVADLEEDARQLYIRMGADIIAVAAGVAWPTRPARVVRTLLHALAAAPAMRAALWGQLYREISVVVAGYNPDAVADDVRAHVSPALRRLRQFLYENVDIADPLACEQLTRTMLGQAAGA